MGRDSTIQWTHHTFNPWRGCTKVSAGCANCYAEAQSKRNLKVLGEWGPQGTRVIAAESYWRQPMAWDKAAAKAGERHRVFCGSLMDVFEGRDTMPASSWATVAEARSRLFRVIDATPNLDWLLLTKRPQNIEPMWHSRSFLDQKGLEWGASKPVGRYFTRDNVWLGTSVEDQDAADKRIPELLKIPAAVRFLSCEPLLGPVNVEAHLHLACCPMNLTTDGTKPATFGCISGRRGCGISWVIIGGESGSKARPCNVDWIRSIVGQCGAAGVPVFVKQMGARIELRNDTGREWGRSGDVLGWEEGNRGYQGELAIARLEDSHGGDPDEWPADLRVREFPMEARA